MGDYGRRGYGGGGGYGSRGGGRGFDRFDDRGYGGRGFGGGFRGGRGGGYGGGGKRTCHRALISGLPPTGSWQDLKDHMRRAGDVCFTDVFRDGTGVVEYARPDDLKYALRKLDDTKFTSHQGETSYITVREDLTHRENRSRSRSPHRSSHRSRSRSRSPRERERSARRSRTASRSRSRS